MHGIFLAVGWRLVHISAKSFMHMTSSPAPPGVTDLPLCSLTWLKQHLPAAPLSAELPVKDASPKVPLPGEEMLLLALVGFHQL